jgi:hypothetical protein
VSSWARIVAHDSGRYKREEKDGLVHRSDEESLKFQETTPATAPVKHLLLGDTEFGAPH